MGKAVEGSHNQRPAVGFPGFLSSSGGKLHVSPAMLRTVAQRKMMSIRFLSAQIRGEKYNYDPWVVAVIEYRESTQLVGVYRTDEIYELGANEPALCLLLMSWERDRDVAQAYAAFDADGDEGYRTYLASGPQLATSTVFGSVTDLGDLVGITDVLVDELGKGLTIAPQKTIAGRPEWEAVYLDVADGRAMFSLEIQSGVSRCQRLEELLPAWLTRSMEIANRAGREPDDAPHIAVEDSWTEVLSLPVVAPRSTRR